MKAKQIPITSGPAAGTLVTRVESNSGKLLGFIRVVKVAFPGVCYTVYIAQQENRHYGQKACPTLEKAYLFLGISRKELEESDLGEYRYEEHTPNIYWLKTNYSISGGK